MLNSQGPLCHVIGSCNRGSRETGKLAIVCGRQHYRVDFSDHHCRSIPEAIYLSASPGVECIFSVDWPPGSSAGSLMVAAPCLCMPGCCLPSWRSTLVHLKIPRDSPCCHYAKDGMLRFTGTVLMMLNLVGGPHCPICISSHFRNLRSID